MTSEEHEHSSYCSQKKISDLLTVLEWIQDTDDSSNLCNLF